MVSTNIEVPKLPLLVICGPSGCGKSTILDMLFKRFPDKFGFSVSHTTRKPREGEKPGHHYHFTTPELMNESIAKGEFLETAKYSGNIYGTSIKAVETVSNAGKICVLDIEMEGVKQVKQKPGLDLILVFIKPPSIQTLEARLRSRGTETEESLKRRLSVCKEEIRYGQDGNFDIVIVNDDLAAAYGCFEDFLIDELLKRDVELDKPSVN
ncbi:uncharacterized protein [Halyomorpha halys]|uniref:uncharacterized protein n=1 Tax=Halyomorpha halys TaxID=286706 RepID=UPI0006D4E23F|nr:guanylate kinase [Halyomorpha halys]